MYLATPTTNRAQIFTGLIFDAYVEIQQVRRLVFDNYQVSTSTVFNCGVFLALGIMLAKNQLEQENKNVFVL